MGPLVLLGVEVLGTVEAPKEASSLSKMASIPGHPLSSTTPRPLGSWLPPRRLLALLEEGRTPMPL